jgi:hypothetical protein
MRDTSDVHAVIRQGLSASLRATGATSRINEMNRNARFRLTGVKHRLEHTISMNLAPAESRQEGRMSVENSPLERFEYGGHQFLHVTGQKTTSTSAATSTSRIAASNAAGSA